MMDISNYKERKTKGLIGVAQIGPAVVISTKQFNQADGTPMINAQATNMEEALKLQQQLQTQLDDVNEFIADIKALTPGV